MQEDNCQHHVNEVANCPHKIKVKIVAPYPVTTDSKAFYFCYAHLSAFAKNYTQAFLAGQIQRDYHAR